MIASAEVLSDIKKGRLRGVRGGAHGKFFDHILSTLEKSFFCYKDTPFFLIEKEQLYLLVQSYLHMYRFCWRSTLRSRISGGPNERGRLDSSSR